MQHLKAQHLSSWAAQVARAGRQVVQGQLLAVVKHAHERVALPGYAPQLKRLRASARIWPPAASRANAQPVGHAPERSGEAPTQL